jgi:hypothetical protein
MSKVVLKDQSNDRCLNLTSYAAVLQHPTCFFFALDFFQLTPGGGCMSSRLLPTLLLACTPLVPAN